MRLPQTIRSLLRMAGAGYVWRLLLDSRYWVKHAAIGRLMETTGSLTAGAAPDGINFGEAEPAEVGLMRRFGLNRRVARRRFSAGDRCFVARDDSGEPFFMCWVHRGPCYVRAFGYVLRANDNDYYLYHVVTLPEHRSRGIARAALSFIGHNLLRHGPSKIRMLIDPENLTMICLAIEIGYKPVADITFALRLGVGQMKITDIATGEVLEQSFLGRPGGPPALQR